MILDDAAVAVVVVVGVDEVGAVGIGQPMDLALLSNTEYLIGFALCYELMPDASNTLATLSGLRTLCTFQIQLLSHRR